MTLHHKVPRASARGIDFFNRETAASPRPCLRNGLTLLPVLLVLLFIPLNALAGDEATPPSKETGTGFSFLIWGRALLATEQFSQAAAYLEREVQNKPDSTEGYMLLGKAYWGMGRIKDARGAWEKAASLEPRYAPLVKTRLARIDRMHDLLIISNESNAEERVPPFLVRDALSAYFAQLGFNISSKLSGEFLARLTSSLEALAPQALDEIRKMSGADTLILSEATSYLEFQDFSNREVKVTARLRVKAIDLHRYSQLGSYQTLRTVEAPTLIEATEKALKTGAERLAGEILQQIIVKEALKPALSVRKADIVIPKPSCPQGSKIPIEITIHNEGDEEARSFEVKVQETSPDQSDHKEKPIDSFLVASLPPLSSIAFNLEWEAQRPGMQKIVVSLHSNQKMKEEDSGHHQSDQEILVLSPQDILINLYRMAYNYSPPASLDRALLQSQLKVALNPQDETAMRDLINKAIDSEKSYITVVGVGLRPWHIFSEEVALPMAKRAARVDAQRWVAIIRKALGRGSPEIAIPSRAQVYGAGVLLEQVMPDDSVLVKVSAPL